MTSRQEAPSDAASYASVASAGGPIRPRPEHLLGEGSEDGDDNQLGNDGVENNANAGDQGVVDPNMGRADNADINNLNVDGEQAPQAIPAQFLRPPAGVIDPAGALYHTNDPSEEQRLRELFHKQEMIQMVNRKLFNRCMREFAKGKDGEVSFPNHPALQETQVGLVRNWLSGMNQGVQDVKEAHVEMYELVDLAELPQLTSDTSDVLIEMNSQVQSVKDALKAYLKAHPEIDSVYGGPREGSVSSSTTIQL